MVSDRTGVAAGPFRGALACLVLLCLLVTVGTSAGVGEAHAFGRSGTIPWEREIAQGNPTRSSQVPGGPSQGYLSAGFNPIDGASLPPGDPGYDLSCATAVAFDSSTSDLLVTAESGVGWFNVTTDRADRVALFPGPGPVVPGAGPIGPPLEVADDGPDGLLYVTHAGSSSAFSCASSVSGEDYLSVVNASTGSVERTIPLGTALAGIAYDPLNGRVYVADASGNALYVLGGRNGTVLDRIPVGVDPQSVTVDSTTGDLYVADAARGGLTIVNASTDTVVGNVSLPSVVAPFDVVYDAADGRLFVDGLNNSVVAAVDPTSGRVLYSVPVKAAPAYMALDPLDDHLYVSSEGTGSVSVVNASSPNGSTQFFSINDGTNGAAFDPRTSSMYLTSTSSPFYLADTRLHRFDARTDANLGWLPLSVSSEALAVDPAARQIFAGDAYGSILWALNSSSRATGPILGVNPGSLAYDATDRTLIAGDSVDGLYSNTGYVQLVDPSSDILLRSLPTSGIGSSVVAWDSTNDSFWVWDWCGGTYCSSSISNYNITGGLLRTVPVGAEYGESMAYDPLHTELYVSGQISTIRGITGAVYGIDAAHGTVAWTRALPDAQSMTYDPVDRTVYVVSAGNSAFNITILNASTGSYVATASEPGNPNGQPLVYDPVDQLVIAADTTNHTELLAYNASTNALVGTIPLPQIYVNGIVPTAAGGGVYFSDEQPAVREARFDNAVHITSFSALPSESEVNGSLTISVSATGGAGGLSYSFSGLPAPCVSQNSSEWTCHPGHLGTYSVTATVTDARGGGFSATTTVRVFPDLVAGPLSASPMQLSTDTNLTLAAMVAGGVGGYAYRWNGLPPGCSNVSFVPLVCAPSGAGHFNVSLTVEDSVGDTVSTGPVAVEVVGPLAVTVSTNRAALDVGQSTNLTAVVTGALRAYAVSWSGLPPGCVSANQTVLACSPARAGTYSVSASATVSPREVAVSNPVSLRVNPALSAPTVGTSRGSLDLGQPVTLWANATGGSGNYTIVWTSLPPGCPALNLSPLTCTPTRIGTYPVEGSVADSLGSTVPLPPTLVQILGDPEITAFAATPSTVTVGTVVNLSVTVTGGSRSYAYDWAVPSICTTADRYEVRCQPVRAGTYSARVTVVDSYGVSQVSPTVEFNATPASNGPVPPPTPLTSILFGTFGLIVLGSLGVALAVTTYLIIRRRRHRREPGKESSTAAGGATNTSEADNPTIGKS